MTELTGEATELLQSLILNRCVNDGTPEELDAFVGGVVAQLTA